MPPWWLAVMSTLITSPLTSQMCRRRPVHAQNHKSATLNVAKKKSENQHSLAVSLMMVVVTWKQGHVHMATPSHLAQLHVAHIVILHCKTMVGVCAAMSTAQNHNILKFQTLNVGMPVLETLEDAVVQDGAMRCTASLVGLTLTTWAALSTTEAVIWSLDLRPMVTQDQLVQRHALHSLSSHCSTMAGVCAEMPTAPRLNTAR